MDKQKEKMENSLSALYNKYAETIAKNMPEAMNNARTAAIEIFSKNGFPKRGSERYKYTDVAEAYARGYGYSFTPFMPKTDRQFMFRCTVPGLDTYIVTIINGWLDIENTTVAEGVVATSIENGAKLFPDLFNKYYNQQAEKRADSIVALNTAFSRSGLFLYIPDNLVVDKPIQIINIMLGPRPMMVNQRNLIIAGRGSQSKILLCDHTQTEQKFLLNNVSEIVLQQDAKLDCYNIQNFNDQSSQISTLMFEQETNSHLLTNTLTLHGHFVRNNLEVLLKGEHAEANIYGLSLPKGTQHVDNYTFIDHAVPNCNSYELYKNILNDESTGAFSGYVLVRKDAQKTNAMQTNKNICITKSAKIYTKPQLEIYADDVKCSHGATVGQLDDAALFYMQQRGIGKDEARMMLMSAFAHEVVSAIDIPALAERYKEMIENRLRGKQTDCGDCMMHCNKK